MDANIQIVSIITQHPAIKAWATQHNIPCEHTITPTSWQTDPSADIFINAGDPCAIASLLQQPPLPILQLATLEYPAYTHRAVSWAILDEQTQLTWHWLGTDISATLSIESHDTAETLLAALFNAAGSQLISAINSANPVPFATTDTLSLPSSCLDWQQAASKIEATCRALHFGNEWHPFAAFSCALNDRTLYIDDIHSHQTQTGLYPGTVVQVSTQGLRVTTATDDITIKHARTQDNQPACFTTLGLSKGSRLPSITASQTQQLLQQHQQQQQHEKFWVQQLQDVQPLSISHLPRDPVTWHDMQATQIPGLDARHNADSAALSALTAILLSLYLENQSINFTVAWHLPQGKVVPLSTAFQPNMTFDAAVEMMSACMLSIMQHKTYCDDIYVRYPTLRATATHTLIGIIISDNPNQDKRSCCHPALLHIHGQEAVTDFYVATHYLKNPVVAQGFHHLLERMAFVREQISTAKDKKLAEFQTSPFHHSNKQKKPTNNQRTSLIDRFNTLAAQVNKPIIERDNIPMTYSALQTLVHDMALKLQAIGIQPHTLVAIHLEPGLQAIVSHLAILSLGAACLLIDPTCQAEHITHAINDSRAGMLLSGERHIATLKKSLAKITFPINFIALEQLPETNNEIITAPTLNPDDLAYMLYEFSLSASPRCHMYSHHAIAKKALSTSNLSGSDALVSYLWRHLLTGKVIHFRTKPVTKKTNLIENTAKTIMKEPKTPPTQATKTITPMTIESQAEFIRMLMHDLHLDRTIVPLNTLQAANTDPHAILITGCTGFIGAHLLQDLLRHSHATIYCLIREKEGRHLENAISETIERYTLNRELFSHERIQILQGDMTKPQLGLSDSDYHALASNIDAIYHCAADVNLQKQYYQLRAVNVLGTIEIIKLASRIKLKAIHAISTLTDAHLNKRNSIAENFPGIDADPMILHNGYTQTKYVAEKLLATASERLIPVTVYRPSWIIGSSITGSMTENQAILPDVIQHCLRMGIAPDWKSELPLVPVDFVSEMISKISLMPHRTHHVYNLVNSNTMTWQHLVQSFVKLGYKLTVTPAKEWVHQLMSTLNQTGASHALPETLDALERTLRPFHHPFTCETKKTQQIARELEIAYPILSAEFAIYCLGFHSDRVFFPHLKNLAAQKEKSGAANEQFYQ
ncbi:MAG: hypothetical protein DHS20C10_02550 [marine bacterium B5-7]|nr:MAG: hypothetical protein DHS20C10_02550 [marine bacterium B5-7]